MCSTCWSDLPAGCVWFHLPDCLPWLTQPHAEGHQWLALMLPVALAKAVAALAPPKAGLSWTIA